MRKFVPVLIAVLLVAMLSITAAPVQAAGRVENVVITCSSLMVVGTGAVGPLDSGIVNDDTGTIIIPFYSQFFPVIDAAGGFLYEVFFPEQPEGTTIFVDVFDNGTGLPLFEGSASCVPAGRYIGPGRPNHFVLRTITCEVAVFDSPGGQAVRDNRIRLGQTWFINPKPVNAPDGTLWTEIYVSGVPNSYIPTTCVGG
jgi:hypothetical protein